MADCDVCLSMGDGDGCCEFYDSKIVTARKNHTCDECRLPIVRGLRYWRSVGKWEGEVSSFKECLLCYEIREVFSCGEGWMHGAGLWEAMADYVFPSLKTSSPCFAKLTHAAKQFVLDRWAKWKGLR